MLLFIFIIGVYVGISSLCSVPKLSRCLSTLCLRQIGITGKGLNKLAEALTQNQYIATTLTHLDLAANPTKGEDMVVGTIVVVLMKDLCSAKIHV